jgi:hypothetical protein
MNNANRNAAAVDLAAKINAHLEAGRTVLIRNHLRIVKMTKKHAGSVTASGAGIRIYGGPLYLIGSFVAEVA